MKQCIVCGKFVTDDDFMKIADQRPDLFSRKEMTLAENLMKQGELHIECSEDV